MTRRSLTGALLIALAFAAVATAGTSPALKIAKTSPLTVRGTGFRATERVRVTVVTNERTIRWTRTSASGIFTVRFLDAKLVVERCAGGLTVIARGAAGDIARLKLPQPDCPPSLGP